MAYAASPLRIICTTDVHGNYFPYDFIRGTNGQGSLARVYKYVQEERHRYGTENVLLLDAGDILQGQPSAYYYNFVDTTSVHVCADVMNYMHYDAATIGNHDVETGHEVYDRWTRQCHFPILAANVVSADGSPYWRPYTVVEKAGLRIAVFGLLTPTIPRWLPENLWSGMVFVDMVQTARKYMPLMQQEADLIVGLFHSGVGQLPDGMTWEAGAENASLAVAKLVPGFDIIFCGHDHRSANTTVLNIEGQQVPVLNAGPNAHFVACTTIFDKRSEKADRQPTPHNLEIGLPLATARTGSAAWLVEESTIVDVRHLKPEKSFMHHFKSQIENVKNYTRQVIGKNPSTLSSRDAYFGPSAFIDLIHTLQLQISGADISFAAPLGFDTTLPQGVIRVGDMYTLYPYENHLYIMQLTGREILGYMEYSYGGWTSQQSLDTLRSEDAHLLNFRSTTPLPDPADHWKLLAMPSYNFDSAAGLRYTVDVTRPIGQRVHIESLADGSPFNMDATYRVALNSYRGNGGGGHLTEGAGIPHKELPNRIVWNSERDLRHYMAEHLRLAGSIQTRPAKLWRFIPEDFVKLLIQRDYKILFPQ